MSAVPRLSRRLESLALASARPVTLKYLYDMGTGGSEKRLSFARFLHRELQVRNAQAVKELQLLPYGLADTQGVSDIRDAYGNYVDMLADTPRPNTIEDNERFTELLHDIHADRIGVVHSLGRGVHEIREAIGYNAYEDIRSEVDLILDRFLLKRIGLRFLLEHHMQIALQAVEVKPGVSGIIHNHVSMGPILRECASQSRAFCIEKYGCAPEVEIFGDGQAAGSFALPDYALNIDLSHDRQFTYVPIHLQFSCSVLLQNACYAVAERHRTQGAPLADVRVTFAYGEDEVTVKVSDEGGGVPNDDLLFAWSYFSAPGGSKDDPGRGHRHSAPLGSLQLDLPPAAGLPLARLHARYYGGDLVLKPIQGLGTDAYLVLNRLGQNCENLPQGVRVSPAMSDSSLADIASIRLDDSLGDVTEAEAVALKQLLQEYRAKRKEVPVYPSSVALP